jgi:hypothetical protein
MLHVDANGLQHVHIRQGRSPGKTGNGNRGGIGHSSAIGQKQGRTGELACNDLRFGTATIKVEDFDDISPCCQTCYGRGGEGVHAIEYHGIWRSATCDGEVDLAGIAAVAGDIGHGGIEGDGGIVLDVEDDLLRSGAGIGIIAEGDGFLPLGEAVGDCIHEYCSALLTGRNHDG